MIGKSKRVDGLYIIDASSNAMKNECNSFKVVCNSAYPEANYATSNVLHHRLGHFSFKRLEILKNKLHFKNDRTDNAPCYIYPLAKQRRLSFVSNNHLSPNAFNLVH